MQDLDDNDVLDEDDGIKENGACNGAGVRYKPVDDVDNVTFLTNQNV